MSVASKQPAASKSPHKVDAIHLDLPGTMTCVFCRYQHLFRRMMTTTFRAWHAVTRSRRHSRFVLTRAVAVANTVVRRRVWSALRTWWRHAAVAYVGLLLLAPPSRPRFLTWHCFSDDVDMFFHINFFCCFSNHRLCCVPCRRVFQTLRGDSSSNQSGGG